MNAAIYARKSTEQAGRSEEQKSVTRQIENARAFATKRGWTVAEEHIYVDDGISGAEFKRRPGFQRLMRALQPQPPFSVLIVSEQKSIGREAFETNFTIKQLAEAGVEIFEYVHGESLTPRNWMDKVMSAFRSGADEAHREQTRERVHEAHSRLAAKGYVTGGRVFGYRNQHVYNGVDPHGNPLRSHVERVIDAAEAAVVVRMFELYASGLGLKAIAKQLRSENAASPKPFKRKDGLAPVAGWSPSTVRTILCREIYRGVIVWNKSRKRTPWGKVDQQPRPRSEWQRIEAPDLRIVSDDLWTRVSTRRQQVEGTAVRFASGRLSGRPPKHAVQNLLAGLATCAECGGGLIAETSSSTKGPRSSYYVCNRRRRNGGCTNTVRIPVAELNEAVLQAIEEHALTPEAVEQVIALTERDDARERQIALNREAVDIDKRIARLVAAIEAGGDAASLVAKLRELETRRAAIGAEASGLQPVPRLPKQVVADRLAEWRRLLRQSTTQGRAVLQRLLQGRITFRPVGSTGYTFEAPTRFDKLFAGIAVPRPAWIPDALTGTEGITAADTFDADYGRVLERAYAAVNGKGMASPAGFEPALPP